MATSQLSTTEKNILARARGRRSQTRKAQPEIKQVPIQVMVPESVRRQVAMMSAEQGESIRTVVLRALRGIGISIEDSQLADRRGRRRQPGGNSNGQI
jgi:trimethylamine:corrinoid methyltransferase-like protein